MSCAMCRYSVPFVSIHDTDHSLTLRIGGEKGVGWSAMIFDVEYSSYLPEQGIRKEASHSC